MFRLSPIVFLLFWANFIQAQKAYFQQQTNYNISVSLDDEKHVLTGNATIDYTNNSPDNLTFIYFHLWYNAFSNKKSAYAKQELRNGKTAFYFAENDELGGMTDLDFKADGKKCEVEIDKENPDIAKVILQKPLKMGEKVTISTPFKVQIPKPFSRGGHVGQQYLMTQWFPKPAVYDRDGWHPMPYLDQGEFYAEFGNFDVSITLPENYVVGSTGVLQTASEIDFLNKKIKNTEGVVLENNNTHTKGYSKKDSVSASSKNSKTIRFTAENVHDFAWFADKAFNVLKSEVVLKNGKKVETYAYFRSEFAEQWKKAPEYINRAVKFYSDLVGDYPHPHVSAVMANGGYEGGMEYPMITVLAGRYTPKDLDVTIAHEVGHNWFQGILGSNERDNAWMDEGLNSYYDHRYTLNFYANTEGVVSGIQKFLTKKSDYTLEEILLQRQDFNHKNQAIQTPSNDLTETNYYMNAYEKPAEFMKILENYYGKERFDDIMRSYYEAWKFKHPQPTDFKKHWETSTGDNMSWLFDGLMGSTKQLDYKISDIKDNGSEWILTIENKSGIAVPFEINCLKNNNEVSKKSFKGIVNQEVIKIEKGDFDLIALDNNHLLPDINRSNNYAQTIGHGSTSMPWSMTFLGGIDNSKKKNIYWSPALAANKYDGAMLGLLLHNGFLPEKKWNWAIAPLYATSSNTLTGVADIDYSFFKKNHKITLSAAGKRFTFKKTPNKNFLDYSKITPSVTIDFWRKPLSQIIQSLSIRHTFLNEQSIFKDSIEKISIKNKWFNISEISYSAKIQNTLTPTSFRVCVEKYSYEIFDRRQKLLKTTFELNQDFMYQEGRKVYTRLFVGGFPVNTGRNSGLGFTRGFLGLSARGFADYRYDDYYLGRNEVTGLLSQQIGSTTPEGINEGGLKYALPEGDETRIGYSNNFIASLNLKAHLPVKLPLDIKPYFDIGYFSDTRPGGERTTSQWLMSGGLSWELSDYFGIYVPLYFSGKSTDPNSLHSIMTRRGGFLSRVTFSVNLKKLDLRRMIKAI